MRFFARALLAGLALFVAGGSAVAATPAFTATVTSDSADIRDKATSTALVVDHVFRGRKLPAFGLSPDKKWVRVKGPAGIGWVARSHVTVTNGAPKEPRDDRSDKTGPEPDTSSHSPVSNAAGPPPAAPAVEGNRRFAFVTAAKTNVLLNANDASPTLAVASRNDVFEVGGFSRDKTYVKVRSEDGRIGWILKSDLRPGHPDAPVAKVDPPPRVVENALPSSSRPSRRSGRSAPEGDLRVWADGGVLLFHEVVRSKEGYGYSLSGNGFAGGVRFDRRLAGGFGIEGGYLGTANQRLPAPGTGASVFSTTQRFDFSARYKVEFTDEDGPSMTAVAGLQSYTFYVQPQTLDFFYSQFYNGGTLGLGGDYGFGNFRVGANLRYLVPVLAAERYGNGAKGADGQSSSAKGMGYGLDLRYRLSSGGNLGVVYRNDSYHTTWSGVGLRGIAEGGAVSAKQLTGVTVKDEFQTLTIQYARGF